MSYYNSYSDPERDFSLYWLHAMIRRGVWRKTERCEACGQTAGILDWHREDYTPPFGDRPEDQHRGQFELCFRCHMMLHLRMWKPKAWDEYRAQIRQGWRFEAMKTRNFPLLQAQHVWKTKPVEHTAHAPPTRCVLDEIADGRHCPPGRVPGNAKDATPGVPPLVIDTRTREVVEEELALRRGGGGPRPPRAPAKAKTKTQRPRSPPAAKKAADERGPPKQKTTLAAQLELLETELREILNL